MKKLIHISFALLLLISTIGITVDKHYCHGHYIGTWFYMQEDACDMDMPMESDWCHDDVTIYSIDSDFQLSTPTSTPAVKLIDVLIFNTYENLLAKNNCTPKFYTDANPPPPEPNIYTKVQSFLL